MDLSVMQKKHGTVLLLIWTTWMTPNTKYLFSKPLGAFSASSIARNITVSAMISIMTLFAALREGEHFDVWARNTMSLPWNTGLHQDYVSEDLLTHLLIHSEQKCWRLHAHNLHNGRNLAAVVLNPLPKEGLVVHKLLEGGYWAWDLRVKSATGKMCKDAVSSLSSWTLRT